MNKILKIFKYILREIGPFIGFYILAYFFDERKALLLSLLFIAFEFIILKIKKQKLGMLFYAFNSVIIFFGALEILNIKTNLYQYEALLTNLIIAFFWSVSVFKEKSIIQEIAESQGRTSSETSLDKKFFFDSFTIFWSIYFLSKGLFYFWMYQLPGIRHPLIIRFFVGKISFWIMLGISLLLPEKIWRLMNRFRVLPSYRVKK